DEVREALLRDLEAARYAADRAFRQYDAADPANRLVAAELETRWNRALLGVAEVEVKIAKHDAASMPRFEISSPALATLADDLSAVWSAPTTDARLKKRIVRTIRARADPRVVALESFHESLGHAVGLRTFDRRRARHQADLAGQLAGLAAG